MEEQAQRAEACGPGRAPRAAARPSRLRAVLGDWPAAWLQRCRAPRPTPLALVPRRSHAAGFNSQLVVRLVFVSEEAARSRRGAGPPQGPAHSSS
jgi:hypothetical protein